ncbi:MAG: hypothetical protein M0R17_03525 [Candidatus Omnitrophica bacterium]|jgi:hypothetical protein|nr:hypothetical protein [Candidatus Omnitrophota bacterium]
MNNAFGFDLSRLSRRQVDMKELPDTSKTLQERVYEEAERQAKAQLGHLYEGLRKDSEFDVKSCEMSFESRVAKIVQDTIYFTNKIHSVKK